MSEQKPRKKRRWILYAIIGVVAVFFLCVVIGLLTGNDKGDPTRTAATGAGEAAADVTSVPKPTETPEPTATPKPSPTPTPEPTDTVTNTLLPTATLEPTATRTPVTLQGSGQAATDPIELPSGIYAAHFTHNGQGNFVVWVYHGTDKKLLVNDIGPYDGTRPLVGGDAFILDINADGAWSISIEPLGTQRSAAFSGRGDATSGLFNPPTVGAWEIRHNGEANFVVWSHCAGGSSLIQNEIGSVDGSRVISFNDGPCFWEVCADGEWTLNPRQ